MICGSVHKARIGQQWRWMMCCEPLGHSGGHRSPKHDCEWYGPVDYANELDEYVPAKYILSPEDYHNPIRQRSRRGMFTDEELRHEREWLGLKDRTSKFHGRKPKPKKAKAPVNEAQVPLMTEGWEHGDERIHRTLLKPAMDIEKYQKHMDAHNEYHGDW